MDTVLLTIVFFASAGNAEFKTQLEMTDPCACAQLAERWLAYHAGMLQVRSATCKPAGAPDLRVASVAEPMVFVSVGAACR